MPGRALKMLALAIGWISVTSFASGQTPQAVPMKGDLTVGVGYMAVEANSPPGSCGCFLLHGGSADAGLYLGHAFEAVVQVAGVHAGAVPGTTRGLSTITLLSGPRYSFPVFRGISTETHALVGAVRGFDADLRRGDEFADTATALAWAAGGSISLRFNERFSIRVVQAEYLRSNLPNGASNRQNLVRFGAGVVFKVGSVTSRR